MKTKTLLLLTLMTFSLQYISAQKSYTITVQLSNLTKGATPILYMDNGDIKTPILKNGAYIFKGTVKYPIVAELNIGGDSTTYIETADGEVIPPPGLKFFVTNSSITIKGDAGEVYNALVTGTKENTDWNILKQTTLPIVKESWILLKKSYADFTKTKDSAIFATTDKARATLNIAEQQATRQFITQYPNAAASSYLLYCLMPMLGFEESEQMYTLLSIGNKNSYYGKQIESNLKKLAATAIGKPAIELNKKDIYGKPVNLSALKGKYVLLDFWGSWCTPCRESHPHLKQLYKQYKDKGFEIIGIAHENGTLKECRDAWKKAIADDAINWVQVLNNEGQEKWDLVNAYGINAFPTKILLDKNGKILLRIIGDGNELDMELKKVLGE